MKRILGYITIGLLVFCTYSCEEYDTPTPELQNFGIYEIVDGEAGTAVALNSVPANTKVRMQIFTDCDICTVWTGEFSYRPFPVGVSDSILDSHAYEHYGLLGAQGHSTGQIEGDTKGWFLDYTWEPGNYTVTMILTNHGIAGPDYKQSMHETQITVQ